MRAQKPNESHSRSTRKGETQRHSTSSGMQKRHSKAMRAPRRHVRREVGIWIRLPADHDEIAGEVAEQNVVLSFWTCASFAAPATLRRMFQYVEAWSVLHVV